MTKTFWTVRYAMWCSSHTYNQVFDNRKDAYEFYENHHADKPVAHVCRNKARIAGYESAIEDQKYDEEYYG